MPWQPLTPRPAPVLLPHGASPTNHNPSAPCTAVSLIHGCSIWRSHPPYCIRPTASLRALRFNEDNPREKPITSAGRQPGHTLPYKLEVGVINLCKRSLHKLLWFSWCSKKRNALGRINFPPFLRPLLTVGANPGSIQYDIIQQEITLI